MVRPRYSRRCDYLCTDRYGRHRDGEQWVHIYGTTLWVCSPCALKAWKEAGLDGPLPPRWVQDTLTGAIVKSQLEQDAGLDGALQDTPLQVPA
jgi:hypothetical protein